MSQKKRQALLIFIFCFLTVTIYGCNPSDRSKKEADSLAQTVFKLTIPKIEGRMVSVVITKQTEANWTFSKPTGLLVVYCTVPNFDVRSIGRYAKAAFVDDKQFPEKELYFSTMVGKSADDYLGAWWYLPLAPAELQDTLQELSIKLTEQEKSGRVMGEGELTFAVVEGKIGSGDFALLSEPFRTVYGDGASTAEAGESLKPNAESLPTQQP